jgi:uncharacterized membrane protein YfcA
MELIFLVVAFFAVFLGNIAAFGISSILLPVAVNLFQFRTGLVLTSIFHIFGNFGRIGFFRGEYNRRLLLLFGVPNILFTYIGAYLVGIVQGFFLRFGLGIILVVYSSLGLVNKELRFNPSDLNCVIGGSIYGFFSGFVGSGGPLRGAILTSFGLTGGVYVATNGGISLFTDITRISVYLWRGYLLQEYYWYIPVLLLIALTGGYFSKVAVKRFSNEFFRKIIHLAVLLAGLDLLLNAIKYLV